VFYLQPPLPRLLISSGPKNLLSQPQNCYFPGNDPIISVPIFSWWSVPWSGVQFSCPLSYRPFPPRIFSDIFHANALYLSRSLDVLLGISVIFPTSRVHRCNSEPQCLTVPHSFKLAFSFTRWEDRIRSFF